MVLEILCFVNKTVNNISEVDVEDELTEIFPTAEDADFTYTSRLKIEQKPNVELDFRVDIPQSKEGLSPLSTFDDMQKVIFEDFTNELFTNHSTKKQNMSSSKTITYWTVKEIGSAYWLFCLEEAQHSKNSVHLVKTLPYVDAKWLRIKPYYVETQKQIKS